MLTHSNTHERNGQPQHGAFAGCRRSNVFLTRSLLTAQALANRGGSSLAVLQLSRTRGAKATRTDQLMVALVVWQWFYSKGEQGAILPQSGCW